MPAALWHSGLVATSLPIRAAASKTAHKPPAAERKYKNIRVLKGLPADQLLPTMREYNTSLGVHCDFCHTVRANHTGYETDHKLTKQTARQMIRLVQSLNAREKILNHQATCFMCHHGEPEPTNHAPEETSE